MFKIIASQSGLPLLVRLLGIGAAFALSVVLARTLGLEGFGAYSLVISTIMMLSIPVQAGIPVLATREVSRAKASDESGKVLAFVSWSNEIILSYSAAIVAVMAIIWLAIGNSEFARDLLIASISVATIALALRNSGILRGLGQFVRGSAPDVFVRPASQLTAFLVLIYFVGNPAKNAVWAIATFVIASFIAWATSLFWRRAALPKAAEMSGSADRATLRQWKKAALLLTVVGGGQIFFGHIDTIMLGALGTEREVGAYRVAVQISMLMIILLTVVNQIIQPKISLLHANNDLVGLQSVVADSSLLMFLATLVPATLLAVFAADLLQFVFGEEYRIAATALQILVFAQVMNVFFGSVGTILNMTGLEKEAMRGMLIAMVINIVLDVILIPLFDLTGAALASALTVAIWNAILRHYVKTRLDIESSGVIQHSRKFFGRSNSRA